MPSVTHPPAGRGTSARRRRHQPRTTVLSDRALQRGRSATRDLAQARSRATTPRPSLAWDGPRCAKVDAEVVEPQAHCLQQLLFLCKPRHPPPQIVHNRCHSVPHWTGFELCRSHATAVASSIQRAGPVQPIPTPHANRREPWGSSTLGRQPPGAPGADSILAGRRTGHVCAVDE